MDSGTLNDQANLRSIYQGSYVEKLRLQNPERIGRLVPHFELGPEDVVADFGCGTGLLVDFIGQKVRSYTGVDWSEEFIDVARHRVSEQVGYGFAFECADIVEFCRQHESVFDKAFTLDFSEHIYDSTFLEIYSAIYDAMKPGATLYLHTPNGEYFLELLKEIGVLNQTVGHVSVRTARVYQDLLSHIGFAELRVIYIPHYVAPLKQLHFLSHLPLLGRFFRARMLITARK
jgi:2-polyprenyl-6-hydroxyphenyl methylase / 3-demethylubiquinone-9 3-methyltransferase